MDEHGQVGEGRKERGAYADGEDGGGGSLAVCGEVEAGDETYTESMDGREGLGNGAVWFDHDYEWDSHGNEEKCERGSGDPADSVVASMSCAGDEGALDEREGEGRVCDLREGAAGGCDGNEREVKGEELGVVREFVVSNGLR